MLDVDALLKEVSPESPCGEDLEYTAVDALDREARVKPEQQIGDTLVPGEEPDWRAVRRNAIDLFAQTKDLRVTVILANAVARVDGWPGFRDALALLDGLLARYWADVHPQLDPDEPDDFTLRMNLVSSLADADTTLRWLREAPLVESVMGRCSLRDVMVAEGELARPTSDDEAPDSGSLDAAVQAAALEDLQAIDAAILDAQALLGQLEGRLMSLVGAASAPDLSPLTALVGRARKAMVRNLALRPDAGLESGADADAPEPSTDDAATGVEAARPAAGPGTGPIASRDDVRRALKAICAYYREHEPSSPIPILLQRAEQLISKDFTEIIANILPDGLPTLESLRGPQEDSSE